MKKEYDFSNARKNPQVSQLKKQITIRLDEDSISYFKEILSLTKFGKQELSDNKERRGHQAAEQNCDVKVNFVLQEI